jgi:glycosyltransferase involved in cell wall biosynthesis
MDICIATHRYPPNAVGGGEISCHLLARELAKNHNVEVVSFDGNVTSQSEIEGVKVIRNKPISHEKTTLNLQCFYFLRKRIEKYDIIHTYNMDLMPAIGLLTKSYGIRSVATLNGAVFSRQDDWYYNFTSKPFDLERQMLGTLLLIRNTAMMKAIKNIRAFTTLCPFYKEVFNLEGIPKEKIKIIPNMIDLNFKVTQKKGSGKVKLLYLGNLRWRKGLDILIEAYSILKKQDVELVIIGFGKGKAVIESLIKHKKIVNDLKVLDRIPYKKTGYVYAEADIFVQPYRYPEPIGRTLIEAMRSGLCVITTGNDYHSPIIRTMKDGVLIYPCTNRKLAEKIQLLIDNPDLRMELSKNAQKRVAEVCHPKKIIEKYMEIYEELS